LIDGQRPLDRRALDVLHDQVIRPNIVQRRNVGLIQRSHGASFALETLTELSLGDFYRDGAIKTRVTGFVDITPAARNDGSQDFVWAEFVAY
jgi:hypothetical protein